MNTLIEEFEEEMRSLRTAYLSLKTKNKDHEFLTWVGFNERTEEFRFGEEFFDRFYDPTEAFPKLEGIVKYTTLLQKTLKGKPYCSQLSEKPQRLRINPTEDLIVFLEDTYNEEYEF